MRNVGVFATCLVDGMRPGVGVAMVKLLRDSGAAVSYPPTQTCCGQIALNGGYAQAARALADKCAAEFADYDCMVTPSGSCCGALRVGVADLYAGEGKTPPLADKCFELSEYLTQVGYQPQAVASEEMRVTFHDSCAGLRELGIKSGPRKLLAAVGARVVEMPDAEECCGFGGRFATKFGALSTAMADRKCGNIAAVEVDAVVGGDLGCLLHIEGRLRRLGNSLPVLHWAEVVAMRAGL